jgi:ubiquinone biosynthesis protein UbiJ
MAGLPLPLAQTGLSAINHVLRQQAWARDRLRPHAGRSVRMVVKLPFGPVSADSRIAADGTLELAAAADAPTVTLTLEPRLSSALAALRDGAKGLSGGLHVEGDVMVAAAVGEVAQFLRWDAEEDLSHLVGDRLAHRVGETLRQGAAQSRMAVERASSGVRQFLVDDGRQLVERSELQALDASLEALDRRLTALEGRALRAR